MSHSTAEKLVYMANQIATAFSQQKHEAAVEATRVHIKKFWDPRMRAMIGEHVAHGGEGLSPIAKEALQQLQPSQAA